MSANVDAMVREGINAYKAGRKDEARALLLKATELDQYNEQAWLWLSGLMDTPDDQRTCLENVLAINPDNDRANQGLSYLTGQTSAGNVSPFSASAPPAAPDAPSAPTSVEWSAPEEPAPMPAAWNKPPPDEPRGEALDDWVTNLNLPINQAPNEASVFMAGDDSASSASPFGDFALDENDVFSDGPFSAPATTTFDDEPEQAPPPRRRAALESSGMMSPVAPEVTPEPTRRPRNRGARGNGAFHTAEQERITMPVEPEGEMFGYIPPEIAPTRLPGTVERTPILLTLAMIGLIVLNIAAAVMVMWGILT